MAQPRPAVTPDDTARALLEMRDELDQALAALSCAKPVPATDRARHHVRSTRLLLDTATSGIVAAWVQAAAEGGPAAGDLLAERYAA